jgi:putative membrane protein
LPQSKDRSKFRNCTTTGRSDSSDKPAIVQELEPQSNFFSEASVRLLLHWILSAVAVWIVAHLGLGISVSGPKAALIAAAVIGLINATLGLLLKIVTFPLTIVTLGLFWFVINALMLELAAWLVNGFAVRNFVAAFIGAIVLSIVSSVLQWLFMPKRNRS